MSSRLKIEETLTSEGVYISTTVGSSMFPMLRDRCDTIVIRPKKGRLKKYDVPLYRRGDSYVLHRVVRVLPDSGYHIRGDNCFTLEKNVPEEAVIGVLTEFWRNGKNYSTNSLSYRIYSRLWVFFHPFICLIKRIRHLFSKALAGFIGIFKGKV